MRCASAINASRTVATVAPILIVCEPKTFFIRPIAQNKLTAVGRVAASVRHMVSNSVESSATVIALLVFAPSANPIAADTPIAGAPRTTIVVITSATCW